MRRARYPTTTARAVACAALAAAALGACKRREALVERHLRLGPAPVALHFARPYHARGPTRELCLEPERGADTDVLRSLASGAPATTVLAVLVRDSGARDSLGYVEEDPGRIFGLQRSTAPSTDAPEDGPVCLWDHGLSNPENAALGHISYDSAGRMVGYAPPEHPRPPLTATYTHVELRSTVPVRVREVSLWTGQRTAFP